MARKIMNIKKILDSLISKFVQPKLFALTLKSHTETFLVLEIAYSLEDAYFKGIKTLKRTNPKSDISGLVILLFVQTQIAELLDGFIGEDREEEEGQRQVDGIASLLRRNTASNDIIESLPKEPEAGQAPTKNELMKQILKKKDLEFLKENESQFNSFEYTYLEGEIKKSKKTNGTKL